MDSAKATSQAYSAPWQLIAGLILVGVAWPINWMADGLRTHLLFFPLWLGYALAVDGLVYIRRGTSLMRRNWRIYISLFLMSAPVWWLFEILNWRTQNWQYVGSEIFSPLTYFITATISFSTVIPAVFGTAELVSSFGWLRRMPKGPVLKPSRLVTRLFFIAGLTMLGLLLAWPRLFFPFLWLSLYFILAPVNVWLGNRSLSEQTAVGDWRPVLAIFLGTLVCGFFWEMWNLHSHPKWIYHVDPFEFLHIFEMPLLGYGGYLPFGLELFAIYQFVARFMGRNAQDYLRLGA